MTTVDEYGGVDLLDAGLRAARRGWRIFPCNGRKQPLISDWDQNATTDEMIIRPWAAKWPGALWAYALPPQRVVTDLDLKHGKNGIAEFEKLQGCHPDQFEAPRVATASGGRHLHMDAGGENYKNTKDVIAPGIDTRASGGYVIIPSGPQSGYRWLSNVDTPLPTIPTWANCTLRRASNFEPMINGKPYQGLSVFGNIMLTSAREAIRTALGGQQEVTLNDRSYQIGRYVGGGLLEREPAVEDLVKAGLQMKDYDPSWEWTEKEVRFKVSRAIDAGILKPLDDGTEIERAVDEAGRRALHDPQYAKAVLELLEAEEAKRTRDHEPPLEPPPEPQGRQEQEKREDDLRTQEPRPEPPKQAPAPAPGAKKRLVRRAGHVIPSPAPFCIDGLIHEQGTGNLASKYYSGKTAVAMSIAASIVTGVPFAGRKVLRPGAVLWLAAEGEQEVDILIRAAVRAMGGDPEQVPFYTQQDVVPKFLGRNGEFKVKQIVDDAVELARAEFNLPLALVVIDTEIKAAGYQKSESDSVEVQAMNQMKVNIARESSCFVLGLDHMGWKEEHVRGSSDKPSSVDVYAEIKTNGGRFVQVINIKTRGGHERIGFQIVEVTESGQRTRIVKWASEWNSGKGGLGPGLSDHARVLLDCINKVIESKGVMRSFKGEPARRCAQKKDIREGFKANVDKYHANKFDRAWKELVGHKLVTTFCDSAGEGDNAWVYFEMSYP